MMILLFDLSGNSGTPFASRTIALAEAEGVPSLYIPFGERGTASGSSSRRYCSLWKGGEKHSNSSSRESFDGLPGANVTH